MLRPHISGGFLRACLILFWVSKLFSPWFQTSLLIRTAVYQSNNQPGWKRAIFMSSMHIMTAFFVNMAHGNEYLSMDLEEMCQSLLKMQSIKMFHRRIGYPRLSQKFAARSGQYTRTWTDFFELAYRQYLSRSSNGLLRSPEGSSAHPGTERRFTPTGSSHKPPAAMD